MHIVQLIYDRTCPNVSRAREVLRQAYSRLSLDGSWEELDRESPSTPEHLRRYGSPTILVAGRDIAGAPATSDGTSCRLYDDGNGRLSGVPSVELVVRAIESGE